MTKLQSMTGFARASDERGDLAWVWEARSVNGRGLDIRVRTPKGFDEFEALARSTFNEAFTRGNIQVSLTINRAPGASAYAVDEALLSQLISRAGAGENPAALSNLMSVPGILVARPMNDVLEGHKDGIVQTLNHCVETLLSERRKEGQALLPILSGAVRSILTLTNDAQGIAAVQPAAIKASFEAKFSELIGQALDPDRIAAEAAHLAIKADIREELDRLIAHCGQAQSYLDGGSPIGRKLEFLAQEFNREINTLCSKSSDVSLTRIGLEMKSMNEQFREQAANVE